MSGPTWSVVLDGEWHRWTFRYRDGRWTADCDGRRIVAPPDQGSA